MIEEKLALATLPNGEPEIFSSIQGEGPHIGRPSMFIRLTHCNLYCRWCDTAYTWRRSNKFPHDENLIYKKSERQLKLSFDDILRTVEHKKPRAIVFTGGEPLLQQKRLLPLLDRIHDVFKMGIDIDFETNGTIAPSDELVSMTNTFVVSPKTSNSGVAIELRESPIALKKFVKTSNAQFKFVVSNNEDVTEVLHIIQHYDIESSRVWLMPLGTSSSEIRLSSGPVLDSCLRYGFNFSDRLHIHLFGNEPGT